MHFGEQVLHKLREVLRGLLVGVIQVEVVDIALLFDGLGRAFLGLARLLLAAAAFLALLALLLLRLG